MHIGFWPIAEMNPGQLALVDPEGREWSRGELFAECNRVAHGELELALITLPQQLSAPLVATPLWNDPLNICVAADHALAAQSEVHLRTLSNYPAILPDENTFTHRQVADLLRRVDEP